MLVELPITHLMTPAPATTTVFVLLYGAVFTPDMVTLTLEISSVATGTEWRVLVRREVNVLVISSVAIITT